MKYNWFIMMSVLMGFAIPPGYAQTPVPDQSLGRFQQMQTTMDQMPQAKTPEERRKLMGEHIKLMQEQMTGMRPMMDRKMGHGGTMMDGKMGQEGGMRGGAATADGSAATDPKIALQLQTLEQRMDIMQRMMEQMVEQMAQDPRLWSNG